MTITLDSAETVALKATVMSILAAQAVHIAGREGAREFLDELRKTAVKGVQESIVTSDRPIDEGAYKTKAANAVDDIFNHIVF